MMLSSKTEEVSGLKRKLNEQFGVLEDPRNRFRRKDSSSTAGSRFSFCNFTKKFPSFFFFKCLNNALMNCSLKEKVFFCKILQNFPGDHPSGEKDFAGLLRTAHPRDTATSFIPATKVPAPSKKSRPPPTAPVAAECVTRQTNALRRNIVPFLPFSF